MKQTLKTTKNILFILLITYLLAYLFVSVFFPEKRISIFGYSFAVVETSSMEPEIKVNDVVCIVRANKDKLKVGDIINFNTYVKTNKGVLAEINVTHYLGYKAEDGFFYKTQSYNRREEGSFDFWYDEKGKRIEEVPTDALIGKVAFYIPYLGHLTKIFQEPLMLMLLAINTLLIILLVVIIKNKKPESVETKQD
jgi:signal peptidase I